MRANCPRIHRNGYLPVDGRTASSADWAIVNRHGAIVPQRASSDSCVKYRVPTCASNALKSCHVCRSCSHGCSKLLSTVNRFLCFTCNKLLIKSIAEIGKYLINKSVICWYYTVHRNRLTDHHWKSLSTALLDT